MAYAVVQDMIDRFSEDEMIALTNRLGSGNVDSNIAQLALDDAEATINGYIAKQATLPLTSVPASIKRIACDLARYYLHDNVSEGTVLDRYKQAKQELRDMANGVIALPDSLGAEPTSEGEILSSDSVPIFDLSNY